MNSSRHAIGFADQTLVLAQVKIRAGRCPSSLADDVPCSSFLAEWELE